MLPWLPDFSTLLVILVAAVATACETVPPEVAKAQSARNQAFSETLGTYKPASFDESAVIALLQTYRDAYNASDLSRIEGLLTSNFELRYYKPRSKERYTVMVQSREKYLGKRYAFSPSHPRQEKLIVNVRSVLLHPEGKGVVVIAATTYRSKHFNPRYIETFAFKRTPDGWRLRRILVVPVQPKEPQVDIYFAKLLPPHKSVPFGFMSDLSSLGPDLAFKKYFRKLSKTARSETSSDHVPTVVIFREPPPVGARIDITETQIGGRGNRFNSGVMVPANANPYFFLAGYGWWGWGYSVNIKVMMNGSLIAEETLRLPR